jgi:hypothetical protein
MSNTLFCDNRLIVRGLAADRAAFMAAIAGTPPDEVLRPGAKRSKVSPTHPISLHKGIPMPSAVLRDGADAREAWAAKHWGYPWEVEGAELWHRPDHHLYLFRTIAAPPLAWLDQLAVQHCALGLTLETDEWVFNCETRHRWYLGERTTECDPDDEIFRAAARSPGASPSVRSV